MEYKKSKSGFSSEEIIIMMIVTILAAGLFFWALVRVMGN